MFGFSDELMKLAKAPTVAQKVDAHFGADKKDWAGFEKNLNSAKFRSMVKGHPEADKKLQQYVQNVGAYLQSKKVVGKVPSRTSGAVYEIRKLPGGRLGCGCKDWQYKHSHRGSDCDHIEAARMKKTAALSMPAVRGLSLGINVARLPERARKKQQEGYKIRLRSLGIDHPDLHH